MGKDQQKKNWPRQTILAVDLTAINFNRILGIDFF